ncbi:protein of unknown function [Paraburkholderia kururiensis]
MLITPWVVMRCVYPATHHALPGLLKHLPSGAAFDRSGVAARARQEPPNQL